MAKTPKSASLEPVALRARIHARLAQYPNGIAAKYAGRLHTEVERSYSKWQARGGNGASHICVTCGKPFFPLRNDAVTCSAACRQRKHRDRVTDHGPNHTVQWDAVDKSGFRANARTAVRALGISCQYDEFHDHLLIKGNVLGVWAGEVSVYSCQVIRRLVFKKFRFDPGKENLRDGIVQLCLDHRFDPVTEYLASRTWDGRLRLDTCASCDRAPLCCGWQGGRQCCHWVGIRPQDVLNLINGSRAC